MKTKLLLITVLLIGGWFLTANAEQADTQIFECIADTWLRPDSPGAKNGSNIDTECSVSTVEGETIPRGSLFSFNFNIEPGKKISNATLHIFTKVCRNTDEGKVYGYGHDFDEANANWTSEEQYFKSAVSETEICTFTMAGQNGKAIYNDGITSQYQKLDNWCNNLDVTSYVKNLNPAITRVNFLICIPSKDKCSFYSKENTGGLIFPGTEAETQVEASDLMPYLEITFVEDSDTEVGVILPSADLYVRSTAAKNNYGGNAEMELKNFEDTNGNRQYFVGLMSFNLPAEINSDEYEIKSVNLRLVATMAKGSRNIDIYPYNYEFTEGVNWEGAGDNVLKALQNDPIKSFEVKGQSASMSADALNDSYKTVEAWTNNIDLTDHVKQSLPLNTLSIMLDHQETGDRPVKFATKEISTITNEKDASVTFDAKDLVPQLTIIYTKKETQEPEQPEEPIESEWKFESDIEAHVVQFNAKQNKLIIYNFTENELDTPSDTPSSSPTYHLKVSHVDPGVEIGYIVESKDSEKEQVRALVDDETEGTDDLLESNGYAKLAENNGLIDLPVNKVQNDVKWGDGTLKLAYVKDGTLHEAEPISYALSADSDGGVATGVQTVEVANDGEAVYYNLQGQKVAHPDRGIFIKVCGGKASKVLF